MDPTYVRPNQNYIPNNNNMYNFMSILFQQLKEYYNFRNQFVQALQNGSFYNNNNYIENEFYLIDRKWIQKWKKCTGYNEVSHIIQRRRDLNDADYNWVTPIIKKNMEENILPPLNNKNIFHNYKINPLADFVIINKNCHNLFIPQNQENITYEITYPIKFLKEKLILMLSDNIFFILYKDIQKNFYNELLITFPKESPNKNIIKTEIGNIDFNNWLKKNNFDLDSTEERDNIYFYDTLLKIINKKLKRIKKDNEATLGNTIKPKLNEKMNNNLETKAQIPEELKMKMNSQLKNNLDNLKKTKINIQQNNNMNNNELNKQNNNMNLGFYNNMNMNMNMNNNMNNFNMNNNMNYGNINMNNNFGNNNYGNNNPGIMNYGINNYSNNNYSNMNNNNNNKFINSNPNVPNMGYQFNNNNNQSFNAQGQMSNNNLISNKDQNPNNDININSNLIQNRAGLQNLGQTCYMNSTLQCLSNISYVTNYLLKKFGNCNNDTQPLTVSYSNLLYELFNSNKQYIVPSIFKEVIGKLNPLFEGNHAADAKDLLFFIIEKLHLELSAKNPNQTENTNIDFATLEENSKNENKMLDSFIKDFSLNNKSIISDTFYGITRSTMKCLNCNVIKFSFQTFNLLIFQLKKIKEKSGVYGRDLTLLDAFKVEKKEEILEGENMIYCNNCHGLRRGEHQQNIYGLPSVLIIILNRGKDNKDFNEQFNFPLELDLSNENIVINPQSYKRFYLSGVIVHSGESGPSGHFFAYCRNSPTSQFFIYNDAIVKPANNEDPLKTINSNKDYEKRTPYILFYHHY